MVRPKSDMMTAVERQLMSIIWQKGEASVKDIVDELNRVKSTAYTSVQTMCKVLVDKGYIDFRKEGRAFIYTAKVSQVEAKGQALTALVNQFFGGSSLSLAQHLLQTEDIDFTELQELQQKIESASNEGDQS